MNNTNKVLVVKLLNHLGISGEHKTPNDFFFSGLQVYMRLIWKEVNILSKGLKTEGEQNIKSLSNLKIVSDSLNYGVSTDVWSLSLKVWHKYISVELETPAGLNGLQSDRTQ